MALFQNKNKLDAEKENLINEINKLTSEVSTLQKNKINIENDIEDLSSYQKELEQKIKNRENFFVEHELLAIDTLTGLEFEEYFANILNKLGFETSVTKASGDSGADIIAQKGGIKYIIQCKNYSSAVGNKSVQEVYSANGIYQGNIAIVVTNNYFTEQAIKEASILKVELWNRDYVRKLLYEAFHFDVNNIDCKKTNSKNKKSKDSDEDRDPFLDEAIELVIYTRQASTSFIQRRFKVGYARAQRIIDQLEENGIISSYHGSQPRQVLLTKEHWEELKKQ